MALHRRQRGGEHHLWERLPDRGPLDVEVDARRFRMADATVTLAWDDPMGIELLLAVRGGDLGNIRRLLTENPGLATARLGGRRGGSSTPLHLVTDWPGYFPNGPAIVGVLIDAGADPNALTTGRDSPTPGPGSETPLHYAASSDDVEVAEALIAGGADLNTPNGSIGTPLENAVGYACWHVARLLVARGARVDHAWVAAAMGMQDRLTELLGPEPDQPAVSQAFWHACGAGQRRTADYLLGRGADLAWEPDYAQGTALDAATGTGTRQENVITWLRELGATSTMIDGPAMVSGTPPTHSSIFQSLLTPWQDGSPTAVLGLVTDDYVGHMLHLVDGERSKDEYPGWIERYRTRYPGTRFSIEDQFESGDRVCTRLEATRTEEGRTMTASGINISRYEADRVVEEWAIWTEWRAT